MKEQPVAASDTSQEPVAEIEKTQHMKQFDEFNLKDSITVEGITDDYVWYHSELLLNQMKTWETNFRKLVNIMEARHKEHIKMLQSVMEENRDLKKQLKEQQK